MGGTAYSSQPRLFLPIGRVDKFVGPTGSTPRVPRPRSLRRETDGPETIAFDELFEREQCGIDHDGAPWGAEKDSGRANASTPSLE